MSDLTTRFNVSKATMSRYLVQLEKSEFGKVLCEKRGREHFYSLDRPKALPKIALSPQGLQQLALCRDFMANILPASMQRSIDAALQQATAYLPTSGLGRVESQIKAIGEGFSKGRIDYSPFQSMLKDLIIAIRDHSVCLVTYKKSIYEAEQTFSYAPKKLISYNDAIYIRGWKVTDRGNVNPIKKHGTDLLLHRFCDVCITIRSSEKLPEVPEKAQGTFGYMGSKAFTAKVQFSPNVANYVIERIWSNKQELLMQKDGSLILILDVRGEVEFKAWILGFGQDAELFEPKDLRDELRTTVSGVIGLYSGHDEI